MNSLKKILTLAFQKWDRHPIFSSLIVAAMVFSLYGAVYFWNDGIMQRDDHFFLFRYASLLRSEGLDLGERFDWVHLSKYAQDKAAYPLNLFQLALIPFTLIRDQILALRISDIFWASLSCGVIYLSLRNMKAKWPMLFIAILLSSGFFGEKILSGRAFVLAAGLVFLEIYFAVEKKPWKFAIVSIVHVLWHQSTFFFPLAVAIFAEAARYLEHKKAGGKNILLGFMAPAAGIIFDPHLFSNLWSFVKSVFSIHFYVISQNLVGEGQEVYRINLLDRLLRVDDIFMLLTIISFVSVIYFYVQNRSREEVQPEESEKTTIFMYATFFFVLMSLSGAVLLSGRFFDFFFPSVVVLSALVVTNLLRQGKMSTQQNFGRYALFAVAAFFLIVLGNYSIDRRVSISRNDYRPAEEAAEWIKKKSSGRELVFLQNWSFFPMLFFFNQNNVYTMGMDPIMARESNPDLYWKWYNMYVHNYYCETKDDCDEEYQAILEKMKDVGEEQRKEFQKDNARKILNSIKNDFQAKFIVSGAQPFSESLKLNSDLIEDKIEAKSDISGEVVSVFKLK